MPEVTISIPEREQALSEINRPPARPQTSRLQAVLEKLFSFHVLLGMLLVLGVFAVKHFIAIDPDTWWHIKVGNDILATHSVPHIDHFSFTVRGAPWIAYEWLGEVVLALAARAGMTGLEMVLLAGCTAIVLLIYYYAWLRCKECKAAFLAAVLVIPVAMLSMNVRPQLFGYAFFTLTLICLERFRQGHRNAVWVLPPLFLIWVNTHGSFVLGFAAMGFYWASGLVDFSCGRLQARRWARADRIRLEAAALASLLVLLITPYGTRLAAVPIEYAFFLPGTKAQIQEWQQANFTMWQFKLFILLVLLLMAAFLTTRAQIHLAEISLVLLTGYETCIHSRFAIVFAIVAAPMLASVFTQWTDPYDPAKDKPALNAILIFAMAFGCFKSFPSRADLERKIDTVYPVQAVQYLRQHPAPEPMFNDYNFGGYLVWSGMPHHGVFIDGRGDLYEHAGIFADFRKIATLAPGTLQLLGKYNIQSCLIQKDCPLATFLSGTGQWQKIYQDDLCALFVRRGSLTMSPQN